MKNSYKLSENIFNMHCVVATKISWFRIFLEPWMQRSAIQYHKIWKVITEKLRFICVNDLWNINRSMQTPWKRTSKTLGWNIMILSTENTRTESQKMRRNLQTFAPQLRNHSSTQIHLNSQWSLRKIREFLRNFFSNPGQYLPRYW